MTIKEVSKKYGISTDILRYYERADLDATIARLNAKIGHYESVIDEQ